MKAHATILAVSLFAFAASAPAGQPVCPCWETIDDLAGIVTGAGDEVEDCDTVAQTTVLKTFDPPLIHHGSNIQTKKSRRIRIGWTRAQGEVRTRLCVLPGRTRTAPPVAIDVTNREYWACTNILRAFCKSEGF